MVRFIFYYQISLEQMGIFLSMKIFQRVSLCSIIREVYLYLILIKIMYTFLVLLHLSKTYLLTKTDQGWWERKLQSKDLFVNYAKVYLYLNLRSWGDKSLVGWGSNTYFLISIMAQRNPRVRDNNLYILPLCTRDIFLYFNICIDYTRGAPAHTRTPWVSCVPSSV